MYIPLVECASFTELESRFHAAKREDRRAPMTLDAGTKLGPYEVLGLLGQGGMGEVYRS